jgi:polyhydroxyalkanoate synthesis repressor PhaR
MSFTETTPSSASTGQKPEQTPVVVKKYANRRLYNTESSSYITLDNLATMIRQSRDFVVYDAKSGEDITHGVLTQIIVEEESKGRAILPTAFLRQIIGFYGNSLQQFVPSYLEQAMTSFATQQEQMRAAMQQTMGNLFPGMQEVSRQNMVMMEQAMNLFAPFYRAGADAAAEQGFQAAEPPAPATPANANAPEPQPMAGVEAMQKEIESLRKQLAAARMVAIAPAPRLDGGDLSSATPTEAKEEPAA